LLWVYIGHKMQLVFIDYCKHNEIGVTQLTSSSINTLLSQA